MSKAKGGRRERQARDLLQEKGFEAHRKVNNAYDSGDIFGLFDLVAVKKGEKVKLIQVKSNNTSGSLKEIKNKFEFPQQHIDVEVWVMTDYKGWRIYRLKEDGWSIELDERKTNMNVGEKVKSEYNGKNL